MKNFNKFRAMIFLISSSCIVWGSDNIEEDKKNPEEGKNTSSICQFLHPRRQISPIITQMQKSVDSLTPSQAEEIYNEVKPLTRSLKRKFKSESKSSAPAGSTYAPEIYTIPQEIWNYLFKICYTTNLIPTMDESVKLNQNDLGTLSMVSKYFYKITGEIWKFTPLVLSNYKLSIHMFNILNENRLTDKEPHTPASVRLPSIHLEDIKSMGPLPKYAKYLKSIKTVDSKVKVDELTESLPKLTALTELIMDSDKFTYRNLNLLSGLTNLVKLDLSIKLTEVNSNIRDNGNYMHSSDYSKLLPLIQLNYLNLAIESDEDYHCICSQNIGYIARLTSLTNLNLNYCIRDFRALPYLTNLTNLQTLSLRGCNVTNCLGFLSLLSNLKTLILNHANANDADIVNLNLFTSLTRLELYDIRNSNNQEVQANIPFNYQGKSYTYGDFFKEFLPGCEIIFDIQSTIEFINQFFNN